MLTMESKELKEQMAKLLNGLTDEQKKKAEACETAEELIACLHEIGFALPDELLDTVAGGGAQADLEFIQLLTLWDDICRQRGIGVYDAHAREQVWKELNKSGS